MGDRTGGGTGQLWRSRVALFDRFADRSAAFGRRAVRLLLDPLHLAGKGLVFQGLANPTRVIGSTQVVQPRFIVHAFGHLEEEHQVFRAQVELAFGAAEIETAVRSQLTFRIFSAVTTPFDRGHFRFES